MEAGANIPSFTVLNIEYLKLHLDFWECKDSALAISVVFVILARKIVF